MYVLTCFVCPLLHICIKKRNDRTENCTVSRGGRENGCVEKRHSSSHTEPNSCVNELLLILNSQALPLLTCDLLLDPDFSSPLLSLFFSSECLCVCFECSLSP